ncbi:NtaA/DmoA family FMN-dependent monooxygenase [Microbacterium invictum]|uniref:FMN-dependent oxidoreductase (Nitrilotriacetate monooxygenase family) n=1 Tax=Microbacterium invictum TaxID=515415 RepID=A0AA40VMC4_9MICO|nr:NtaA/DmoA family FMN-dependent monooxygenase [Microbacterium invictum]MBB4140279.1 FMN-dependent oxidoreductase (nitrilotriacetate monooxygenase family) [Microbacterium invictum]
MNLMLFHSPLGRMTHSWRRATSRSEELTSIELALHSAQRAEDAKLDAMFLSDTPFYDPGDIMMYEPVTTIAALGALTKRVGLVGTIPTTYTQPYDVARYLASIDFISKGRAGWNIVTLASGEENYSHDLPPKSERYAIAEDYLQAATKLWDAWDDDAVVRNLGNGDWVDPARVHRADHHGPHYRTRGPLPMPRSPQGRPVLVQAGQSPEGRAFGARWAEVVFTSQNRLELAQEFYADMRDRAERSGRPDGIPKVLPGIVPLIASTQDEAEKIAEEIAELYPLDRGLIELSEFLLGADLAGLDLDEPIPLERLVPLDLAKEMPQLTASRYENLYRIVVDERPTLRQMVRTGTKTKGHQFIVGTPTTIADRMQAWYEARACDGFVIIPPYMPEGLDAICDDLVPELVARGLFRAEYPGTTLRDTLGLVRPAPVR